MLRALGPNAGAVAREQLAFGAALAAHAPAEPHRADRIVFAPPGWPGNTGDGKADVGGRVRHGACGHGARHGLADGDGLGRLPVVLQRQQQQAGGRR